MKLRSACLDNMLKRNQLATDPLGHDHKAFGAQREGQSDLVA
ncbi:hypothetical protein [Novosphingobium sp. ES2-1]|nr:hypothetical protein [Novosphingobium sp. ES2-1]